MRDICSLLWTQLCRRKIGIVLPELANVAAPAAARPIPVVLDERL
jgi:hypothetical protein